MSKPLFDALGGKKVTAIRVEDVQEFMAVNQHRPSTANRSLGIVRAVLEQEVLRGTICANPAWSVERLPIETDAIRIWTEQDIVQFSETWAEGTAADLAFALMLYTGAGRSIGVQLGPENVKAGRLTYRRSLAECCAPVTVDIPLHPDLSRRLSALPTSAQTYLGKVNGKPRSAAGLGNAMREWCDVAGLPECTAFGLRKACSRRLAEAGATEQEIASVLGYTDTKLSHEVVGMGERPTLADAGIQRLLVQSAV